MADDENHPRTPSQSVADRVSDARRDAKQAKADVEAVSRRRLDELKRRSVEDRFKALGENAPELLPQHRRELLRTLQGQEIARSVPINAGFASRWELFRARLPYRVVPLALIGFTSVIGIGLVQLSRTRTPAYWVVSRYTEPVQATFTLSTGQLAFDRLEPGERYAVLPRDAGTANLRRWVPGTGYATAQVPSLWLNRVP